MENEIRKAMAHGEVSTCRRVTLHASQTLSKTDLPCEWSKKNPPRNVETKTISELFPSKAEKSNLQGKIKVDIEKIRERILDYSVKEKFKTPVVWMLKPEPLREENPFDKFNLKQIFSSSEFLAASDKRLYLNQHFNLDDSIIQSIAKCTVGQWKNDLYCDLHTFRITASNFGSVIGSMSRNQFSKTLFQKLQNSYNLGKVKSIEHGRENERKAIIEFGKLYREAVQPAGVEILPMLQGLFFHKNGVLAASPDAIKDNFVVEVKCLFKFKDVRLTNEVLTAQEKYVIIVKEDDSIEVNKKHEYYSQLQGQIHLCNKEYGYFVIWTKVDFLVVRVNRDNEWAKNLDVMEKFFYNVYVPSLLPENN